MKKENILGLLFVGMSIAILVSAISPTRDALINPYENWIETKDLKNCTISFIIDATYSDSVFGEERADCDCWSMRFENGEFDSSNNTFKVSNTTERYDKTYEGSSVTIKSTIEKECQVVFDSGANNIKSFSASEIRTMNTVEKNKDPSKMEISIKGSGPSFPFKKKIEYWVLTESGVVVKIVDMKNTSYTLRGLEDSREYVKDKDIVIRMTNTFKVMDKYETHTRELTSFEFDDQARFLEILFDGYLPRLRDSEGTCSWFGGKNDTGIDVTHRKKFYEEHVDEYTPADFTYEEFYKNKKVREKFDKWMKERPKSTWEGTGLDCGYARELDTENDYFCAMRWHDKETERYNNDSKPGSKYWWREQKIKVTNTVNNISVIVAPVDWGPNVTTGRVIDLSHRAMEEINATTDVTRVEMCLVDSDTPLGLVTNQQDNKKIKKFKRI